MMNNLDVKSRRLKTVYAVPPRVVAQYVGTGRVRALSRVLVDLTVCVRWQILLLLNRTSIVFQETIRGTEVR